MVMERIRAEPHLKVAPPNHWQRWFECQGTTKKNLVDEAKMCLARNPPPQIHQFNERRLRAESVIQFSTATIMIPNDDVPRCDGWPNLPPGFQTQPHRPSVASETQDRAPFAIREKSSAFVDRTGPYKGTMSIGRIPGLAVWIWK